MITCKCRHSGSRSSSPIVFYSCSLFLLFFRSCYQSGLRPGSPDALGDITAKARETKPRKSPKDSRVSNGKKKTLPGMGASENRMPRDHILGVFCSTLNCCCSPRRSPGPSAVVSFLSSTSHVEQSLLSFVHTVLNFLTLHVMANACVVIRSIQRLIHSN